MKLLHIICLAANISLTPIAFAGPHSNLHDAHEALTRAQTTQDTQDIRTAQHCLENAVAFAKGQKRPVDWGILKRKDALDQVNQALKAREADDHFKAAKFIEQALKLTDEAVSQTPKRQ
jgi:hypothetical protein